ncbi:hypothetical protein [Nocardia asiatica]|uniref:hypothetical protein n=1 Tax=Nocardia asiatica TaxID=209252 RepID=UPI0024555406|nr:hypothetical protein [Nocardia asiatica]
MTKPSAEALAPRYRAVLTSMDGSFATTAQTDEWLESPRAARAWLRERIRYAAGAIDPPAYYRAVVVDSRPMPHISERLYNVFGSGPEVLAVLADQRASLYADGALVSGEAVEVTDIFKGLLRDYEQATAEFLREPDDAQLNQKRLGIRTDLQLTVESLPMGDQRQSLSMVEETDLLPLARPDGRYIAVLEVPAEGSQFRPIRQQRFDSGRPAREWLRTVCESAHPDTGPVRATILHVEDDGTVNVTSTRVGTNSLVAGELRDRTDYDGVYVTGIVGVDRTRLAHLVAEYQATAGDTAVYQLVNSLIDPTAVRRERLPSRHSQIGTEIAVMLSYPHLADQAEHWMPRLERIDQVGRSFPNTISDSVGAPSSGFVTADLQITLDQHHDLQAVLSNAAPEEQGMYRALISEAEQRIFQLLPHPTLTATERFSVMQDLAKARTNPHAGHQPIFALPNRGAIESRAAELAAAPRGPDSVPSARDVDNAMRLYQLTRIAATSTESERYERIDLRATISAQREALLERISDHPHLSSAEKGSLKTMVHNLAHDPYRELPLRRAAYVDAPTAIDERVPIDPATADNHTVSFYDPQPNGRQLVVGTENGQWTGRSYVDYPGHPQSKLEVGASTFPDAATLVAALRTGHTYRDSGGAPRYSGPVEVPEVVQRHLGKLSTTRGEHPKPAVSQTGPQPAVRRAAPSVAPRTSAQRRQDMRKPANPGPSPQRRTGR